ncbi:MAG TPA: DNA repair protein RecO [Candidatus Binatia bacterium]|nr:DNA repair protein RecO [Candidatus Binatia bacterium]
MRKVLKTRSNQNPAVRPFCVTPAIVLRSWPFGESDKIVSFFTEGYGKVNGIAKGAKRSRKRFVNTLEPFSLVNLSFRDRSNRGLAFVHACDLVRPFRHLITSLEKIAYASYIVEITEGLSGEREENRALFEHLREGLVFLEEGEPTFSFLTFFELRLLRLAGYQPTLQQCRRCLKVWASGTRTRWYFSSRDGGILCESCATLRKEILPVSVDALHVLKELEKSSPAASQCVSCPEVVLKESLTVLLKFIQSLMNRELKSAPFLESFSLA